MLGCAAKARAQRAATKHPLQRLPGSPMRSCRPVLSQQLQPPNRDPHRQQYRLLQYHSQLLLPVYSPHLALADAPPTALSAVPPRWLPAALSHPHRSLPHGRLCLVVHPLVRAQALSAPPRQFAHARLLPSFLQLPQQEQEQHHRLTVLSSRPPRLHVSPQAK